MSRNLSGSLCVLAFVISLVLSLTNPTGQFEKALFYRSLTFQSDQYEKSVVLHRFHHHSKAQKNQNQLKYDFYRYSCPKAEQIVRDTMKELYSANVTTSPQLLRLFFHDCFVGGCDASILLDENASGDNKTEKDAPPNQTLKGFEKIEIIKARLEEECPRTVSCADTLALAAREGVVMAGGPYYPLMTGRGDSDRSDFQAAFTIPSPSDNITTTLANFGNKGFDTKETVSLLGAHNIGNIDCVFIRNRIYNFSGTGKPDPSLTVEFSQYLRNFCDGTGQSSSPLPSKGMAYAGQSSPPLPTKAMTYADALFPLLPSGTKFGTQYYVRLQRNEGVLFADQQLMVKPETAALVDDFAADDGSTFRRIFARAMLKMSTLGAGQSKYQGSVRFNCSRLIAPVSRHPVSSYSAPSHPVSGYY